MDPIDFSTQKRIKRIIKSITEESSILDDIDRIDLIKVNMEELYQSLGVINPLSLVLVMSNLKEHLNVIFERSEILISVPFYLEILVFAVKFFISSDFQNNGNYKSESIRWLLKVFETTMKKKFEEFKNLFITIISNDSILHYLCRFVFFEQIFVFKSKFGFYNKNEETLFILLQNLLVMSIEKQKPKNREIFFKKIIYQNQGGDFEIENKAVDFKVKEINETKNEQIKNENAGLFEKNQKSKKSNEMTEKIDDENKNTKKNESSDELGEDNKKEKESSYNLELNQNRKGINQNFGFEEENVKRNTKIHPNDDINTVLLATTKLVTTAPETKESIKDKSDEKNAISETSDKSIGKVNTHSHSIFTNYNFNTKLSHLNFVNEKQIQEEKFDEIFSLESFPLEIYVFALRMRKEISDKFILQKFLKIFLKFIGIRNKERIQFFLSFIKKFSHLLIEEESMTLIEELINIISHEKSFDVKILQLILKLLNTIRYESVESILRFFTEKINVYKIQNDIAHVLCDILQEIDILCLRDIDVDFENFDCPYDSFNHAIKNDLKILSGQNSFTKEWKIDKGDNKRRNEGDEMEGRSEKDIEEEIERIKEPKGNLNLDDLKKNHFKEKKYFENLEELDKLAFDGTKNEVKKLESIDLVEKHDNYQNITKFESFRLENKWTKINTCFEEMQHEKNESAQKRNEELKIEQMKVYQFEKILVDRTEIKKSNDFLVKKNESQHNFTIVITSIEEENVQPKDSTNRTLKNETKSQSENEKIQKSKNLLPPFPNKPKFPQFADKNASPSKNQLIHPSINSLNKQSKKNSKSKNLKEISIRIKTIEFILQSYEKCKQKNKRIFCEQLKKYLNSLPINSLKATLLIYLLKQIIFNPPTELFDKTAELTLYISLKFKTDKNERLNEIVITSFFELISLKKLRVVLLNSFPMWLFYLKHFLIQSPNEGLLLVPYYTSILLQYIGSLSSSILYLHLSLMFQLLFAFRTTTLIEIEFSKTECYEFYFGNSTNLNELIRYFLTCQNFSQIIFMSTEELLKQQCYEAYFHFIFLLMKNCEDSENSNDFHLFVLHLFVLLENEIARDSQNAIYFHTFDILYYYSHFSVFPQFFLIKFNDVLSVYKEKVLVNGSKTPFLKEKNLIFRDVYFGKINEKHDEIKDGVLENSHKSTMLEKFEKKTILKNNQSEETTSETNTTIHLNRLSDETKYLTNQKYDLKFEGNEKNQLTSEKSIKADSNWQIREKSVNSEKKSQINSKELEKMLHFYGTPILNEKTPNNQSKNLFNREKILSDPTYNEKDKMFQLKEKSTSEEKLDPKKINLILKHLLIFCKFQKITENFMTDDNAKFIEKYFNPSYSMFKRMICLLNSKSDFSSKVQNFDEPAKETYRASYLNENNQFIQFDFENRQSRVFDLFSQKLLNYNFEYLLSFDERSSPQNNEFFKLRKREELDNEKINVMEHKKILIKEQNQNNDFNYSKTIGEKYASESHNELIQSNFTYSPVISHEVKFDHSSQNNEKNTSIEDNEVKTDDCKNMECDEINKRNDSKKPNKKNELNQHNNSPNPPKKFKKDLTDSENQKIQTKKQIDKLIVDYHFSKLLCNRLMTESTKEIPQTQCNTAFISHIQSSEYKNLYKFGILHVSSKSKNWKDVYQETDSCEDENYIDFLNNFSKITTRDDRSLIYESLFDLFKFYIGIFFNSENEKFGEKEEIKRKIIEKDINGKGLDICQNQEGIGQEEINKQGKYKEKLDNIRDIKHFNKKFFENNENSQNQEQSQNTNFHEHVKIKTENSNIVNREIERKFSDFNSENKIEESNSNDEISREGDFLVNFPVQQETIQQNDSPNNDPNHKKTPLKNYDSKSIPNFDKELNRSACRVQSEYVFEKRRYIGNSQIIIFYSDESVDPFKIENVLTEFNVFSIWIIRCQNGFYRIKLSTMLNEKMNTFQTGDILYKKDDIVFAVLFYCMKYSKYVYELIINEKNYEDSKHELFSNALFERQKTFDKFYNVS